MTLELTQATESEQVRVRNPRPRFTLIAAVATLAVIVLAAVFAPLVAPFDPASQDLLHTLEGPSRAHWLGTDDVGRDILSRIIWGARASLGAAAYAVTLTVVLGTVLGLVAGYFGGITDSIIMRVADAVLAVPGLILAITVVGILGPSLLNAMTAVAVIFVPTVARLVRARTLSVNAELYVDSARTLGYSPARILFRHVLPNSVQPVVVQIPLLLSMALLAEASLSFLGFGVQPPTASWGQMLSRGQAVMLRAPWQIIPPGGAIVLTSVAFAFVAEAARRRFEGQADGTPSTKESK